MRCEQLFSILSGKILIKINFLQKLNLQNRTKTFIIW